MSASCPYCSNALKFKSIKVGRFTIKCPACGRPLRLTVQGDPPTFTAEKLPGEAEEAAFDPEATAPSLPDGPARAKSDALGATAVGGVSGADNADFSVSAPAPADETTALGPRQAVTNLDATEIDHPAPAKMRDEEARPMPAVLGNYQILRELGRGGMGAVYLARQMSLDRPVALKVMNEKWAANPAFLVRFTREAYAAAQLVHHNVVQVYDIGADRDINYFSMEFVEGQSLGDLVKARGKVEPAEAAGYALQAARGLKFAHDRGMIHRDIKPDNLMLNNQGIVKVADLGLVRTPGLVEEKPDPAGGADATPLAKGISRTLANLSGVTMVNQAMGTPSYMAPEQARDATTVDRRADIYSLGCTLYVMITGKPVFEGSNALEVITKHASEPIVRPEVIVKNVPKALSDIIVKMVAKKPDDRYADMTEVIEALEAFLGLHGQTRIDRAEEHARVLELSVKAFQNAGTAKLRGWILPGLHGGCALLFFLVILLGWWRTAGGILGLSVCTSLAYFLLHGSANRTHLFFKVRDLARGASWLELAKVGACLVILLCLLYLTKLLVGWLIALVLGIGVAFALHYALDKRIAAERQAPLEKVERMLRNLRLKGISEEALQEFVRKYAGERWEEYFEAQFGYEAKLSARLRWGMGPKGSRPRYAAWRDPVVRWIDHFQRARQEARERKHLQAIEQKNLVAQGLAVGEAKARAEQVADAMVQKAAEIKKEAAEVKKEPVPAPAPVPAPVAVPIVPTELTVVPEKGVETKLPPVVKVGPRRVNVMDIYQFADKTEAPPVKQSRAFSKFMAGLFGGQVRFAVGAVLLLACLAWMNARHLLPGAANVDDTTSWERMWEGSQKAEPLDVPLVPQPVLEALASVNSGIAGLMLVLSAIWRSWKIGVMQLLAAAIVVVGPMTALPEVGPLTPQVLALAVGGGVSLLGFLFGRDT